METEVTKKLVAGGRGREGKEDIPKRKTPFFFTLKSLSNKQQLFLLHRHFKRKKIIKLLSKLKEY